MGQSPFAKNSASAGAAINRRRSTRVEFVVPIIISGRDATGQPFREATETILVNAHGASFRTRNQILIGMQLTVENQLSGSSEKAICVRVADCEPGQDQHVVALQLLIPQNIWGMKDPPADWQHAFESRQPAPPSTPAAMPVEVSTTVGSPAVPAPSDGMVKRSSELTDSTLQQLRQQAAEIVQDSLKEFERRLKVLEAEAEARMLQRAEKTNADSQFALEELRGDFLVDLATQTERSVAAAEEGLRERMAEMFGPRPKPSPDARAVKRNDPNPK